MTEDRKRLLTRLGYAAFGVLLTLFFVYATFPLEVLQGRIMRTLAKSGVNLPFKISFVKASPYRLSGLELEDVTLLMNETPGKPSPEGGPLSVHFDRLQARIALLPLLRKVYDVNFGLDASDNHLSGEMRVGPHETGIVLNGSDLDLAHPPLLQKVFGVTALGSLDINLDFLLDDDVKKSVGGGTFKLRKGATSEVTVMGFTVPALDLGTINGEIEVKDGTVTVKEFGQKGNDLEAKITGDIQLRKPNLLTSVVNLGLKFKMADAFLQKNPKFKTMMQLFPALERTKSPDGFYAAKVTGTLQNPLPSL